MIGIALLMVGITRTGLADDGKDLADKSKFTKIDVPGAADTQPQGINPQGDIVGSYNDSSGNLDGFLLSESRFTTINAPGAAGFTDPFGINPRGDIVGIYVDTSHNEHGFLLNRGCFTSIEVDLPGAAAGLRKRLGSTRKVISWVAILTASACMAFC